jgi:NADPH:quinone reductase-like Zn-dependent oxidoreductase
MGLKSELIRASLFFFDGRLSPVVDRVYPLAEVADARRRLESRQAFGKIVLQP